MTIATRLAAFVLVLFAMPGACATSVSLVYVGDNEVTADGTILARSGDLISFDIIADFRDHPTIGGGFDLHFDPAVLSYSTLIIFGNLCKWHCDSFPDAADGFLESAHFGRFNPISGPLRVMRFDFVFIGQGVTGSTIWLTPTSGIGGPFVSGIDFVTLLDVQFNAVQIANVPLPAALWLFAAALPILFGLRRK